MPASQGVVSLSELGRVALAPIGSHLVTLRLHDTLARQVRDFVPLTPGEVLMYQCGATVQSAPHVGHIRSGVVFDLLSRWLTASGYRVVLCRNVTDIDDKILARAEAEERPWWAVAAFYERAFQDAYNVLGCAPPTVEPRATGHVTQMVELMQRLIERGHAYESDGDVYFDVRSFADYGALSRQHIDDLRPAADSGADPRKRDPRDFALWKSTKSPDEPSWPTPWGPGRPGWHLECSAMATTYLGPQFDIHGGGLDLVFPHHENEMAQSRAAGDGFANYWLHNAWVTTAGEKMSKSLGNSLVVSEVLTKVRPVELRWYLIAAHYRSNLEFSDAAMAEAAAGYRRVEGFVTRAAARIDAEDVCVDLLPPEFVDAMNDDLSVPAALAILHEHVTTGNTLIAAGDDVGLQANLAQVRAMLDILGVDPLSTPWNAGGTNDEALATALDSLVSAELAARQLARANKDFAAADEIRDRISQAGITIEDSADGSRWSLAGDA